MNDISDTSESTSTPARIDVDPLQVVVAGTYADSSVDVVHGNLNDHLTMKLPGHDDAVVRMATDGVVMVAKEGVVLVALGVDPHEASPGDTAATTGGIELIARAQGALEAAAKALCRVEKTGRA